MTYHVLNLDDANRPNWYQMAHTLGEAKRCAHLNCQAAEIWHKGAKIYEFDFRTLDSPDVIIIPSADFDYMDPAQRREERNTGTTP